MKQFFCAVCGAEIELNADKTYLASLDLGFLSTLMPSEIYRVINCPVCGCQNKLCIELPREIEDNEPAPELDSERAPAPISVPLTLEQIEKMGGELVVIPESKNSAGGIGRVDLGKNIVEGCAPTAQYAWPLDRYGEMFIAYSVSTDESAWLYWR